MPYSFDFSLQSFLFSGVPSECVHEVESSQILTKNNSLLHWKDAVEDKTQHYVFIFLFYKHVHTCVFAFFYSTFKIVCSFCK